MRVKRHERETKRIRRRKGRAQQQRRKGRLREPRRTEAPTEVALARKQEEKIGRRGSHTSQAPEEAGRGRGREGIGQPGNQLRSWSRRTRNWKRKRDVRGHDERTDGPALVNPGSGGVGGFRGGS